LLLMGMMISLSKLAFEVSRVRTSRIQLLAELGVFSGSSAKSIFVRSLPFAGDGDVSDGPAGLLPHSFVL
jgi:hypothetical protein